jgi:hypothetical protein
LEERHRRKCSLVFRGALLWLYLLLLLDDWLRLFNCAGRDRCLLLFG